MTSSRITKQVDNELIRHILKMLSLNIRYTRISLAFNTLRDFGFSYDDSAVKVAGMFGISRTTVYRAVKGHAETMEIMDAYGVKCIAQTQKDRRKVHKAMYAAMTKAIEEGKLKVD